MASFRVLISRKADAAQRITSAREELQALTNIEYQEDAVTNRDSEVAQVQQAENTAGFLEALASALKAGVPEVESKLKKVVKKTPTKK